MLRHDGSVSEREFHSFLVGMGSSRTTKITALALSSTSWPLVTCNDDDDDDRVVDTVAGQAIVVVILGSIAVIKVALV